MTLDLWGFNGSWFFALPLRPIGLYFLAALLLSSAWLLWSTRGQVRLTFRGDPVQGRRIFVLLLLLSPLAAQTFLLHLPLTTVRVVPGLPQQPLGPAVGLFALLAPVIMGGLFGIWPAALSGFLAGLTRGGWETISILTAPIYALGAFMIAWLMRREYDDLAGRLFRRPLVSALAGGMLIGVLRCFELFSFSGGDIFDGLDFTLSMVSPTLLAATLEAGIAGLIAEGLRSWLKKDWFQPRAGTPAPYNRLLSVRLLLLFILIGMLSAGLVVAGDWWLARASAQELIEREMESVARQAGETVPYVFQTGRAFTLQTASVISRELGPDFNLVRVAELLRTTAFFNRLEIYDAEGGLIAVYPSDSVSPAVDPDLFEISLSTALAGIPKEIVGAPPQGELGVNIAFLAPISSPGEEAVLGAVVGWTDLADNPLMSPVIGALEEIFRGEAFLVDGQGRIVLHSLPGNILAQFNIDPEKLDQIHTATGMDGTQRLTFIREVTGHPWYVVTQMPVNEVQRLALQITVQLAAVLLTAGVLSVSLIFFFSRRLTLPLRRMSATAQSIARGNLNEAVSPAGEDEIGDLALSFESMRMSLRDRLDEKELLLAVSQEISRTFNLKEVFPRILEGIQALTAADMVCVTLLNGGMSDQGLEVFFQGEDPGGWKTLNPQIVELCRTRGRFTLENPARARAILDLQAVIVPIETITALALRNEEEFVGVLWLGSISPRTWSDDEINLLSILVGQLGVAVANARLYQQAEEERLRLAAVLQVTPEAVILVDEDNRLLLFNPAAEQFLKPDVGAALGERISDVLQPDALIDLILSGDPEMRGQEVELPDGKVMYASVGTLTGRSDKGGGRVCILWDVTYYKQLDALKSEFISSITHDLRAPLTLMQGYATMIGMVGDLNEQQRDFVSKITQSIDQMGDMISDLLVLGRIEAGIGLNLARVDVTEIVQDVLDGYRPQAIQKHLALNADIYPNLQTIFADPALLQRAVANLVDNAIKYTPTLGRVTVRAKPEQEYLLIEVVDTGPGIAPADQARLFERFYRVNRAETDPDHGAGLGLAIVKSVAEQHGGTVSVESRLGMGSRFAIHIPIAIVPGSQDGAAHA
ncbi:MAG: HAMP domain-containing protein [Anaerolineales bacterium]|nr:HAMP domain-containing protein [Anaerolineales bacterium]